MKAIPLKEVIKMKKLLLTLPVILLLIACPSFAIYAASDATQHHHDSQDTVMHHSEVSSIPLMIMFGIIVLLCFLILFISFKKKAGKQAN
ncbi:hypothetical protein DFQ01_107146 [Paenibacillus cellulosilyticus]|uniref:Uncharacterized protein n=3 Tax=Paenibacillus cellulosilyticus TaxID=375489 RepID=A0A2V2YWS8_9BACL|nr:hypothetical protein DFQ01_107146 [Paenibacillus cellulosilyticus]